MKKAFTKQDIIKKHETNVKAASTAFGLPAILGLIYIVRFLFSKNLNFYFSLSFTDMLIKSGIEKDAVLIPLIISGVYAAFYFVLTILTSKNPKLLPVALGIHIFDFLCLLFCMFILWRAPVNPDCYIDVIFHIIVIFFIAVGISSDKKLKTLKSEK